MLSLFRPIPCLAALVFAGLLPAAEPAATPVIPDYSETVRAEVPDQYKFKISDLFKDEAEWRVEFAAVAKLADSVDAKIEGWTSSPALVADMLELFDEVNERGDRLYAYARLQSDMDLSNAAFDRMQTEFLNLAVGFETKTAFIAPGILSLGAEKVESYLKAEPRLAPYRFKLEKILRNAMHTLSEPQASIVAQMGLFTGVPVKVSGLLNNVDMPRATVVLSDDTEVLLNQNNYLKYRISRNGDDRRTVSIAYWSNIKQYENTFAALLDAEMKKQVALARIHKFPTCLEATLFENNISPDVYRNVIETVRSNLAPLHRFMKLKQRMLGLDVLNSYDVAVPAATTVTRYYTFEESQRHVINAMAPLGKEYVNTLKTAFDDRWVDIYSNKDKQGGAYSFGVYGMHPFVKLNYIGRYSDMSTLAHELGHSMHSHLANESQPYTTAGYTTFIAEIAAIFNENMLLTEALRTGTDDRIKLHLLESYLERMRGTIYSQALFAEFELAIHEQAEKGQPLTAEWLNAKFLGIYRHYVGSAQGVVVVDDLVGCLWSVIPHFYRPFYVFQYVTGMVASSALAEAVNNGGPVEAERYLTMLRQGGSKFPLDLLRDAGVDMSKPEPIEASLRHFDRLVTEMETIYARLEK